ncbi:uncharacterized protein FA14DRAFT_178177 [Meira miltonrushii]|uniref:Uncharacterized protein n=1 Tax=Meira miltonrushii TaxID=1280837 RepID=A0A316VBB0_9BASI|nr:uncharacterized protein FA14DRAFT_178177 [Meira miltonrushii]PWN34780.1 hypothetical protein FA14DRAFT_178177 [Meira miltonrushii]
MHHNHICLSILILLFAIAVHPRPGKKDGKITSAQWVPSGQCSTSSTQGVVDPSYCTSPKPGQNYVCCGQRSASSCNHESLCVPPQFCRQVTANGNGGGNCGDCGEAEVCCTIKQCSN